MQLVPSLGHLQDHVLRETLQRWVLLQSLQGLHVPWLKLCNLIHLILKHFNIITIKLP